MEMEIFTVEPESLGCYAQSNDFEVGELRDDPTSGYIFEFIHTIPSEILAYPEDSDVLTCLTLGGISLFMSLMNKYDGFVFLLDSSRSLEQSKNVLPASYLVSILA